MACLVLDEADRILDTGFEHDLKKILQHLPSLYHFLLYIYEILKFNVYDGLFIF